MTSLRRSYEYLTGNQKFIIHYGTGLHVSLDPQALDTGLLTARYLALWVPYGGVPNMHGGTYIKRMVRVDRRWLIAEQRITYDWQFDVAPSSRNLGKDQPKPEHPLSQLDLVEERYRLA